MKRRTFLATSAAALAAPSVTRAERARVLRFIPQADLGVLDPVATPAEEGGSLLSVVMVPRPWRENVNRARNPKDRTAAVAYS